MFKRFDRSLSNRLLITTLASILSVAIILTFVIELVVLDNNRETLIQQQKNFTELVAKRVDQGLEDRVGFLKGLSGQLHNGT